MTNDKWLDKVKALLSKAERTDNPAEAEIFAAKAQEIIARNNFSDEDLGTADENEVIRLDIKIKAPYASAKSSILGAVGRNNGVFILFDRHNGVGRLYGRRSDVSLVEAMFTALSTAAASGAMKAEIPYGDSPRAFRHAFIEAFAWRISQRLTEQNREVVETSPGAGIVLADRTKAGEDLARGDGKWKTRKTTVSSSAGIRAGAAAADRASLGRDVGAGSQRALGA